MLRKLQWVIIPPMKRIAFLFVIASILAGCSTDLDINAPYKNVTIVYGLLNQRDSVQYIKINKAYLGAGDALDYAQIADSNEWADGDITVARVHRVLNGNRVGTFDIEPTLFTDREPGVFYAPNQKLYKFVDNTDYPPVLLSGDTVFVHLDQESDYELELAVKGETISATTSIVDKFSFVNAVQRLDVDITLKSINGYADWIMGWTATHDGKRYVGSYRFNYREVHEDGTSVDQSITRTVGRLVSPNTTSNEPLELILEAEGFYSTLGSSIAVDPNVVSREFLGIDLILDVANDEFHTYLTLSEPVSGIVQDRPTYTNIVNGIGLFGARYRREVIGKQLSGLSLQELADGPYTAQLGF